MVKGIGLLQKFGNCSEYEAENNHQLTPVTRGGAQVPSRCQYWVLTWETCPVPWEEIHLHVSICMLLGQASVPSQLDG